MSDNIAVAPADEEIATNVQEEEGPPAAQEARDPWEEEAVKLSAASTENLLRMMECSICKEYLVKATQTSCCGAVFCKRCICMWVRARGTCPVCRMQQIPSKLTLAKYVQRIADELKDDLCPTNDAITDGGTGPSTEVQHRLDQLFTPTGAQNPLDQVFQANVLINEGGDDDGPVDAADNDDPGRPYLYAIPGAEDRAHQCTIRLGQNGSFSLLLEHTQRVICTAVHTRGDGDHSITLTIKSPDDMVVVATLELLPHSDQYLAVDHLGRDIMAVDYMSKDPVLVLPKPVQILNEGSDMTPFAPQSRRDSIWMQVRRPDTSRVNPFEGKSDPYYDFNRKHSWLRHGGRYVQGARTILVLVGPKNNDMPFLSVAYANTERSRVWVDFLHPIAPLQAFAIALTAMDRHRRVLKARVGP
ncbi:hypothetical protein DYB37_000383 [Aphanomyces astaci]|uniref:RING-type domain-containing protein n=1 Tax=Aphanomyces astaci TaxID=112090 RepID=A0A418FFC5_APHAT|nr:hypothetical protein DYB37_000383 [Aphanomyces astaci]